MLEVRHYHLHTLTPRHIEWRAPERENQQGGTPKRLKKDNSLIGVCFSRPAAALENAAHESVWSAIPASTLPAAALGG
jgi:hypothetical protein